MQNAYSGRTSLGIIKLIVGEQKNSPEPGGKMISKKKSQEEMPLSIDMPSNENEKRSTKEHIDKSLAVSSKVMVRNKKNYLKDE